MAYDPTILRAKTYEAVASGECKYCKASRVDLRFVFLDEGDELACLQCGEEIDSSARNQEDRNQWP
jgi:hypothetical protein